MFDTETFLRILREKKKREKETHVTASQPETCLKSFPSIPSALYEAISIQPDYHCRREAINFTLSSSGPPISPVFIPASSHLPPSRFAELAPRTCFHAF